MDEAKPIQSNEVTFSYNVDNIKTEPFIYKIKQEELDIECENNFADIIIKQEVVSVKQETECQTKAKKKTRRTHNNDPFVECSICDKKVRLGRMKFHMSSCHKPRKEHVCVLCHKGFYEYNDLQRHTDENHLKMKNYICSICSKTFIKEQYLRKHIDLVHYKIKSSYCTVCKDGKYCADPSHLYSEIKIKPYSCDICGVQFLKMSGLKWHTKKSHKLLNYKCDICKDKRFLFKRDLKEHYKSIHCDVYSKYVCKYCGKKYKKIYSLQLHTRSVHLEERSYVCDLCDKSFVHKSSLRVHMICRRHSNKQA